MTKSKQIRRKLIKAIVCTKYRLPDVFHLKELDKPTAKDNEVLVKVHATSVNYYDNCMTVSTYIQ